MRILYIGDIMGEPGLKLIENVLPGLRNELSADQVIAQAENVTQGKGISLVDFARLKKAGVDFCTGGNWSLHQEEIVQAMNDPAQPIVRPANYPADTPGLGYKYLQSARGNVLVISLLGQIVGRDAAKPVDNPLQVIDAILEKEQDTPKIATVVNFHGDFSSEKFVIGRYLDGRASLVVGDHWHVPTADAMVLPGGTAHITDVGMCGTLDSCLGVKFDIIMDRWKTARPSRNELETEGRLQFNAVLADIDTQTGLARSVIHVRRIY
ncbi:MAG TPA: TIGR00282 family metallophosphoesterase [Candidatus Saccharimonadales bacterium]|nr:TIGR00282 family metallophosphoesterase [Candidatus Saccharimonadales bacterium]